MSSSKQSKSPFLPSGQNLFDDRRLTAAFVGMASALRSRPEPRQKWDNVAAGRAPYKGRDAVQCGQEVMRAAIITGDAEVRERTASAVAHFFEELKHVALRDYHAIANGDVSLDDAVLKASRETGEALHAILASSLHACDAAAVVREIDEAVDAMSDVRKRMTPSTKPTLVRRRMRALS